MTTREHRKVACADKPTERVEVRGVERVEERERGMKPGEVRAKIGKIRWSFNLSLRGDFEIQAQHWARNPVRKLVRKLGAQREAVPMHKPRGHWINILRRNIVFRVSVGDHLRALKYELVLLTVRIGLV